MKIKIVSKKAYPQLKKLYDEFEVGDKGEICLAIGGDGAFIRAANEFNGPILPIRSEENKSTGYYADLSLKDIDFITENMKKRNYKIEELGKKVEVVYNEKKYYGVNEILLRNVQEEVYFRLYYKENGEKSRLFSYTLSGDGFLVTSNIGSTAYNRSAGGPIILDKDVMCLTFLSLENPLPNPIIIRKDDEIEAVIEKGRATLSYDGIVLGQVNEKESFSVKLSGKKVNVIKFENRREAFSEKLSRIIKSKLDEIY